MNDLEKLQVDAYQWERETFKRKTALCLIEKLKEEVDELYDTYIRTKRIDQDELADCQILLAILATERNINLLNEARNKLIINKRRTWKETEIPGVYQHIEE